MEFAATLAQMEVALFYGVALPVIMPIAATALATHWLALGWLLRQRSVFTLPCTGPPVSYLPVSLFLQAALVTWFFGATQGAAYGWTVGLLSSAAVAGALRSVLCHPQSGPGSGTPLPRIIVSNERGVRLTTLGSGPGKGDTIMGAGAHCYELMAD